MHQRLSFVEETFFFFIFERRTSSKEGRKKICKKIERISEVCIGISLLEI
jgi:hypothetical protein